MSFFLTLISFVMNFFLSIKSNLANHSLIAELINRFCEFKFITLGSLVELFFKVNQFNKFNNLGNCFTYLIKPSSNVKQPRTKNAHCITSAPRNRFKPVAL